VLNATLISNGQQAVTIFTARHGLSDAKPRAAETFHYATAGVTVTIEASDQGNAWDIEIRNGRAIVAIWQRASERDTTYPLDIDAHWPLLYAAMMAAAQGSFLLAVAPAA